MGNCRNEDDPKRKNVPKAARSPKAKNIGIPENNITRARIAIPATGLILMNTIIPIRIPMMNRAGYSQGLSLNLGEGVGKLDRDRML